MESEMVVASGVEVAASTETRPPPVVDERRQYNREYMRRWRANPAHQQHEHGRRRRSYYQRKALAALPSGAAGAACEGIPVCGFCRLKASVGAVERFLIREDEPSGFIPVLIPYCGEC